MYLFSPKSVIFAVIIKNQLTMNRTITTILACICYFAAYAQSGRLFNTDHQLSSNLATQVFQDNNGFIWIATRNGLNVFDGYNFRSMRKGENDPRKPNTNCFNCITQDSHGCIVLGTNRGVLIHDDQYFTEVQLHNELGKTFSAYIPHIKRLHNGNILIGTAGCGIYLMKKGTHTCIPFAPTLGKLKYIHHITEDRQGQLWLIADGNQLFLLNKKGQLIRHAFGTQDLNVRDIQQDSKGTIYLATESQGIYRLTPGSSVFTQITAIPNLPASTIFVNRNDRLFIGCNGEGITLYDPVTNMTYDNLFFSPQTNLSKSKVGSIIEDQQGNIWFSMLQKGVFMQPLSPNDFGYMGYRLGKFNLIGDNSVSSVMFDKDHNLWVGTDKDGIYKLSPGGKHLLGHYAPRAVVLGVCQDTQGRIWIATYTDGAGTLDANGTYHPLDIEAIKNRIQAVRWVPAYSDGKLTLQATKNVGGTEYDSAALEEQLYVTSANANIIADILDASKGYTVEVIANSVNTRAIVTSPFGTATVTAGTENNVLKIAMGYTDLATLWSSFNTATIPTPIKVQLAVKISDAKGNSAMTDFADVVIVNN